MRTRSAIRCDSVSLSSNRIAHDVHRPLHSEGLAVSRSLARVVARGGDTDLVARGGDRLGFLFSARHTEVRRHGAPSENQTPSLSTRRHESVTAKPWSDERKPNTKSVTAKPPFCGTANLDLSGAQFCLLRQPIRQPRSLYPLIAELPNGRRIANKPKSVNANAIPVSPRSPWSPFVIHFLRLSSARLIF